MCPIGKNWDRIKHNLLAWKQLNEIPKNDKIINNIYFMSDSCMQLDDVIEAPMDEEYETDHPISSNNLFRPGPIYLNILKPSLPT